MVTGKRQRRDRLDGTRRLDDDSCSSLVEIWVIPTTIIVVLCSVHTLILYTSPMLSKRKHTTRLNRQSDLLLQSRKTLKIHSDDRPIYVTASSQVQSPLVFLRGPHRLLHSPPEPAPEPEAPNGLMSDDVKYPAAAAFSALTSNRID